MKKMMMTLAALCVAGVVGAVTTSWTELAAGTLNSTTTEWTANTNEVWNGNSDFAIRVTYTGTTKEIGSRWTSLFKLNSSGTTFEFQDNGSGGIWTTGGAATSQVTIPSASEIDVSLMFVYNHEDKTLSYVATDNTTGTSVVIATVSQTISAWITVSADDTNRPLDRLFDNGHPGTYKVEYTTDITGLPEPTALALLALGAAGLALRRRAA